MSNERKPRQILGVNNSKLEGDSQIIMNNSQDNEKLEVKGLSKNYIVFPRTYFPNVANNTIICENENKFSNQSKDSVAMNLDNVNRICLEEMASYWPYTHIISPYCAQPTFGIISSGPAGLIRQVPYFPANPTLSQTYDNSSNAVNPNTPLTQNSKLVTQNGFSKCDETNGEVVANPNIILNQKQFIELTRLAMRGSETAERIANTHRNRPCFKKIDSLCARMKQDLIRPDGVLPNINSQGIAWAVKDFIFVFTRVINAWIIIKGYVYNTPEGLNKIKAALSSDFLRSFAAWQDTTMDFVENLIKSFVNLDQLVQNQNISKKSENVSKNSTSNSPTKTSNPNLSPKSNDNFDDSLDFLNLPSDNILSPQTGAASASTKLSPESIGPILNKSYYSTLVENSEESQRHATANGTYFKTGVYNPIWKDSLNDMDPLYFSGKKDSLDPIIEALPKVNSLEKVLPLTFGRTNSIDDLWSNQQNTAISVNYKITDNSNNNFSNTNDNINRNLINDFNFNNNIYSESSNISHFASENGEGDGKLFDMTRNISNGQGSQNCFSYDFKILEKNVSKFSNSFDPAITKPIGLDTVKKLEILLKKIQNSQEGNLFFEERFMKNYFPDFMSKCPKFLDLRSIFLKAQVGGYAHINEFVKDLKQITRHVNSYLKVTKHELLETAIKEYDLAINKILRDEIFKEYNFDHKTGTVQNNSINI